MQEYNDGSFGQIMAADELDKVLNDANELARTKAIHFGTEEELQTIKNKTKGAFGNPERRSEDNSSVKDYLKRVDKKLDMIIKHFNIVHLL